MAVCCILRQIKKVRPKVNRISLLLCAVEAGACLIRLKSSNVHKKKERMYDPDYRKSKQHGKQFHLGCTGDGVHLRSRSVLKHPDGFLQIRKFPYAIRTTIGRMFRKRNASAGSITPFQAVCTALAATVGTGNIAGVAGAIAIGGPGAVFWMWISAFLGMCTKYCGGDAGRSFPREETKMGTGSADRCTISRTGWGSIGDGWRYCICRAGVLTVFGTGNATQVNTIMTAIDSALLNYHVIALEIWSLWSNLVMGIVIAALVAAILLGGSNGSER